MKPRRKLLKLRNLSKASAVATAKKADQKAADKKEIEVLRAKLDKLDVKYVHNTGLKKLRKLLEEATK